MVAEWLCAGFDIKQSSFGLWCQSNASCSWERYGKLQSVSPIPNVSMGTGWGEVTLHMNHCEDGNGFNIHGNPL